jgi:hypothetical protein
VPRFCPRFRFRQNTKFKVGSDADPFRRLLDQGSSVSITHMSIHALPSPDLLLALAAAALDADLLGPAAMKLLRISNLGYRRLQADQRRICDMICLIFHLASRRLSPCLLLSFLYPPESQPNVIAAKDACGTTFHALSRLEWAWLFVT